MSAGNGGGAAQLDRAMPINESKSGLCHCDPADRDLAGRLRKSHSIKVCVKLASYVPASSAGRGPHRTQLVSGQNARQRHQRLH